MESNHKQAACADVSTKSCAFAGGLPVIHPTKKNRDLQDKPAGSSSLRASVCDVRWHPLPTLCNRKS